MLTAFCLWLLSTGARSSQPVKLWETYNQKGKELLNQAQFQPAEAQFRLALKEAQRQGKGSLPVAVVLTNLAAVLREEHKYGQSESLLRQALSIEEKTLTPMSSFLVDTLRHLASVLRAQQRDSEAAKLEVRASQLLYPDYFQLGDRNQVWNLHYLTP